MNYYYAGRADALAGLPAARSLPKGARQQYLRGYHSVKLDRLPGSEN